MRFGSTLLLVGALCVVAPVGPAGAATPIATKVKRKVVSAIRSAKWVLLGDPARNALQRQGFGHAGDSLDSIRNHERNELLDQQVAPSRKVELSGRFGTKIQESRGDQNGTHVSTTRVEAGNAHGVTYRNLVSSTSRGGPGGRIDRALTIRSQSTFQGTTEHSVVDEQRLGRFFKLERKAYSTVDESSRSLQSKTYLKLGKLGKVAIPWKRIDAEEMKGFLRRSSAPIEGAGLTPAPTLGKNSTRPVNIALGLRKTGDRSSIDEFGEHVGGISYHAWHTYGFLPTHAEAGEGWATNLPKALDAAISRGGRIKFDLTGLQKHNRVTSNELRYIHGNAKLLANTDFYELGERGQYRKLGADEVKDVLRRLD